MSVTQGTEKRLLSVLKGKEVDRPPVWMMRQAGRYLPEYKKVRSQTSNFLEFCYNTKLATEVTLQPITRFGFDASIMFADILVIPDALGQEVTFQEGVGPVLQAISQRSEIDALSCEGLHEHMAPIYGTLGSLTKELPSDVTLIGFAGAPWTVATYMIGGRGSPTQAAARTMAYRQEADFAALMEKLVDATAEYLIRQAQSGAEVLQLFDTWAGSLSASEFRKWCVAPTREIIKRVRQAVDVPIIGFPKGVGPLVLEFVEETGVDGVSLDTNMDMVWAKENLSGKVAMQGNLDPLLVVAGGPELDVRVKDLLDLFKGEQFIFNLGHGLVPETPPENVGRVVDLIKAS